MRFFNTFRSPEDMRPAFVEAAAGLNLPELIEVDQPKLPHTVAQYDIVPIVADSLPRSRYGQPGWEWQMKTSDPQTVEMGYKDYSPKLGEYATRPWVDGTLGLGLTYRPKPAEPTRRLVAVASGRIDRHTFLVEQLQAAWTMPEPRRRDTGLYGGFNWNNVLLRGLVQTSRDMGLRSVQVRGDAYRRRVGLAPVVPSETWKKNYDEAAEAVGFDPPRTPRDMWHLDLTRK